MANKMVHFRMDEKLYINAKELADEFGFSSMQEFFRNAVRNAVAEYEKHIALHKLKALYGSEPNIKKLTPKEREQILEEFIEKKKHGYNAFKEMGL